MECKAHKLVADIAVISEGHILMVQYRDTTRYDGQTGWFLPDDFLENLEHPDDAAVRIGKSQLGLDVSSARLGFIESFGDGAWHLIFHYRADPVRKPAVRKGDNVVAMEWFDLRSLPPPAEVAHHGWCLDTVERLLKAGG